MIPGSTQPAYMVREQGKTFKDVLRAQVPNFDQLDSHRRLLAETASPDVAALLASKSELSPPLAAFNSNNSAGFRACTR